MSQIQIDFYLDLAGIHSHHIKFQWIGPLPFNNHGNSHTLFSFWVSFKGWWIRFNPSINMIIICYVAWNCPYREAVRKSWIKLAFSCHRKFDVPVKARFITNLIESYFAHFILLPKQKNTSTFFTNNMYKKKLDDLSCN